MFCERIFFFLNKNFQEIISLSIVLCLFIHNIGSKHDRETVTSKLTLMLLTLHASLLREISVNFWALFVAQLLNFILKHVLLIILVILRDNSYRYFLSKFPS